MRRQSIGRERRRTASLAEPFRSEDDNNQAAAPLGWLSDSCKKNAGQRQTRRVCDPLPPTHGNHQTDNKSNSGENAEPVESEIKTKTQVAGALKQRREAVDQLNRFERRKKQITLKL